MGFLKRSKDKSDSKGEKVLKDLHPKVHKLMKDGNHSKAEKLLKEALEIDSTDQESWLELGIVYTFKKKYKDSINAFRKSLEINDNNPRAWGALGMALGDSGNKDEAKQAFQKAIELEPDNKSWPFTLASIHMQEDNLEEATRLYERVVEIDPSFTMAWMGLVSMYREMGEHDKSQDAAMRMAILKTQGKLEFK